jgi:hypothetical protein
VWRIFRALVAGSTLGLPDERGVNESKHGMDNRLGVHGSIERRRMQFHSGFL